MVANKQNVIQSHQHKYSKKEDDAKSLSNNDEKDSLVCTSKVCEYDWVLEERHSMTWRTYDDKTGKLNDYQVEVDESTDRLKVITNSFRPTPPYDKKNKVYKDPNEHLSQIFTTDGRSNRHVLTFSRANQYCDSLKKFFDIQKEFKILIYVISGESLQSMENFLAQ